MPKPDTALAVVDDEAGPVPALGDLVLYRLTSSDLDRVTSPPGMGMAHGLGTVGQRNPYVGSTLEVGQLAPAVVVNVLSPVLVSLSVLVDAAGPPLWCPSRVQGEDLGEWSPRP